MGRIRWFAERPWQDSLLVMSMLKDDTYRTHLRGKRRKKTINKARNCESFTFPRNDRVLGAVNRWLLASSIHILLPSLGRCLVSTCWRSPEFIREDVDGNLKLKYCRRRDAIIIYKGFHDGQGLVLVRLGMIRAQLQLK